MWRKRELSILLIALSIILRIVIYATLPLDPAGIDPETVLRFDALRNHLGEVFWLSTIKAPLNFLFSALIVNIFDNSSILNYHPFIVVLFVFDSISIFFIYLAGVRLTRQTVAPFIIMILFSLVLIPFELLKEGQVLDQPIVFFTGLFIYCYVRAFQENDVRSWTSLSMAGSLFILQSTAAAVIVPFSIGLLSICRVVEVSRWQKMLKKIIAINFLPIFFVLLLCLKNFYLGSFFSPSNLGGIGRGQFTYVTMLKGDMDYVRSMLVKNKVPDWYLWCFDHSVPPWASWKPYAYAGGMCFPHQPVYGKGCWPFNLQPLYDYLVSHHNIKEAEIVKKDLEDTCNRPYVFANWQPMMSLRWSGYYAEITQKIALQIALDRPDDFIRAYNSRVDLYTGEGPKFFRIHPGWTATSYVFRDSILMQSFIFPLYEGLISAAYQISSLVIFCLIAIFIGKFIWRVFRKKNSPFFTLKFLLTSERNNKIIFFNFFLMIKLMTLIYCSGAGFEQERYYVQIVPYLLIFITLIFKYIVDLFLMIRTQVTLVSSHIRTA